MRHKMLFLFIAAFCFLPFLTLAQSDFSVEEYYRFLQNNKNLESEELLSRHAPQNPYYKEIESGVSTEEFSYLDSVTIKYELTESELDLLQKSHFAVSERLSFRCFGWALHDIYVKDLPVFVTTDAILHALHSSYDRLLMDIEISILEPNLVKLLDALYSTFPQLLEKYELNSKMRNAMRDVDVYVTIAKSLLTNTELSPQYESHEKIDAIRDAIQSEQLVEMPLFSERNRKLDFSQFTVRGHYTHEFWYNDRERTLAAYFKSMMWLGRMDFMLTPPPENPWELPWDREEIRRMNLGAVLLYELLDMADAHSLLNENDEIIKFMVGESDNLTPTELAELINDQAIIGADDLLDDPTYDAFQQALTASADYGQKILSNFLMMDPFSTEPGVLPVSFRLMGQRFIIDSYIFANVVYDRIIYNDDKIWRPLPDPLDAMFVLGNNDALPLLKEELDTFKYSSQLAALRYLVDAYDTDFWDMSLYNVWLQGIRLLNPPIDRTEFPFFMQTAAWQQEKLNTQLASWTQLRHDNLLYAKQSYTSASGCSFPHSFVEPYPAFYQQIAAFAEKADAFFSEITSDYRISNYFPRLKNVMCKLDTIAQKELDRQALNSEETEFLKKMLFLDGGSGTPPFSGWYADLFYDPFDAGQGDYLVADVHTQPTDYYGAPVGRILHVGVGKINLGVFLADSPSNDFQPMAFVGPVMSYYEKITRNFDRLTDERWTELVNSGNLPARPDWVNIYLADSTGKALAQGRELPGVLYTEVAENSEIFPETFTLLQNYPNPFNPSTTIEYNLPKPGHVRLAVYDALGRRVRTLVDNRQQTGHFQTTWDGTDKRNLPVAAGVYFCLMEAGEFIKVIKLALVR